MIKVFDNLKRLVVFFLFGSMCILNNSNAQTPPDDPGGELTGQGTSDGNVPAVPINKEMNVLLLLSGIGYAYYILKKNPSVL